MLINLNTLINKYNMKINGVFHVGAHECEEQQIYLNNGISSDRIIWVEALPFLCDKIKSINKTIVIYQACVSDVDNQQVVFNITNNFQSSSILELKEHLKEHPGVHVINRISLKTKTVQTLYNENNISPTFANFLNLDIQGAELLCLKGMGNLLENYDYIYTEVNNKELYDKCAIVTEIDDYLLKFNFKRVVTEWTQHGWGDALYIKTL